MKICSSNGFATNSFLAALIHLAFLNPANANTWFIGSTQTYTVPGQIMNLVSDGDTIYINGGVYTNDATKWINSDLKFIGLGTGANRTILRNTGNIPNHKGIFVFETPGTCDNAYIENIVFDGAQVSDADGANGAGIRFQANNLTVKNCKFINCQNGILEGNASVNTSNVFIQNCEFENNGYQLPNDPNHSGYEHHIYISASADTLLVMNNWFHHPRGQANSIKTRAQRSFILYNFIDEEASGYGSWEINIAQGGLNIVIGNIIIQAASAANHGIIGYDAATNPIEDFYFVNNTVINKYVGNASYFNIAPAGGIDSFKVYNNIFASIAGANMTFINGNMPGGLDTSNNSFSGDYLAYGFVDPSTGDFRLMANALLAIDRGTNAGMTNTSSDLNPSFMYQSFSTSLLARQTYGGALDLGAYEYETPTSIEKNGLNKDVFIYPNPTSGKCRIIFQDEQFDLTHLQIFDLCGKSVFTGNFTGINIDLDLSGNANGIYLLKTTGPTESFNKKILLR